MKVTLEANLAELCNLVELLCIGRRTKQDEVRPVHCGGVRPVNDVPNRFREEGVQ